MDKQILTKKRVTQERLFEVLSYDSETGKFTRKISYRRYKAGTFAGGIESNGYEQIMIDQIHYLSHRLAWLYVHGEFPSSDIDHINGIKTDNKLKNLRLASESQNGFNVQKWSNNTSGFKGVYFNKRSRRWIAEAKILGKKYYLGSFKVASDAGAAYQAFALKMHGDFYALTEVIR